MLRFVISLLIGLVVGLGLGLYLGWVQFPVEYINSPASDLSPRYKDEFTVMVAAGYTADRDLNGAIERLRLLGVANLPAHVQETAERFITNSQALPDIAHLVGLAEGLGRLTPVMEPYRPVLPAEGMTNG